MVIYICLAKQIQLSLKIWGKEMVYNIFIITIFIKLKDGWANGFQKSLNCI